MEIGRFQLPTTELPSKNYSLSSKVRTVVNYVTLQTTEL